MRAVRENSYVLLTLNLFESRVLRQVMRTIGDHYRLKPAEIDPAIGAVWYPTAGCKAARMGEEETQEFVENLYGYKRAHLALVERCGADLARHTGVKQQIKLQMDEAAVFLTIVNDHRLLCAAKYKIHQAEMDLHSVKEIASLPATQQTALYEIHLLAYLMEELLRVLEPGAVG